MRLVAAAMEMAMAMAMAAAHRLAPHCPRFGIIY
jgi:hypothetical protein